MAREWNDNQRNYADLRYKFETVTVSKVDQRNWLGDATVFRILFLGSIKYQPCESSSKGYGQCSVKARTLWSHMFCRRVWSDDRVRRPTAARMRNVSLNWVNYRIDAKNYENGCEDKADSLHFAEALHIVEL